MSRNIYGYALHGTPMQTAKIHSKPCFARRYQPQISFHWLALPTLQWWHVACCKAAHYVKQVLKI